MTLSRFLRQMVTLSRSCLVTLFLLTSCAGPARQLRDSGPPKPLRDYTVNWVWGRNPLFSQPDFAELLQKLEANRPRYASGSPAKYTVHVALANDALWLAQSTSDNYSFGVMHVGVFSKASGALVCDWSLKQTQHIRGLLSVAYEQYLDAWITDALIEIWDRVAEAPCPASRVILSSSPSTEAFESQFEQVLAAQSARDKLQMLSIRDLTFLGPEDAKALLPQMGSQHGKEKLLEMLDLGVKACTLGIPNMPGLATWAMIVAAIDNPTDHEQGMSRMQLIEQCYKHARDPNGLFWLSLIGARLGASGAGDAEYFKIAKDMLGFSFATETTGQDGSASKLSGIMLGKAPEPCPWSTRSEYIQMLGKRMDDPLLAGYLAKRCPFPAQTSSPDRPWLTLFTSSLQCSLQVDSLFGRKPGLWLKSEGVKLFFESNVLTEVVLFSEEKHLNCTQFSGPLPQGVMFRDTMQQVREKLGRPTQSDTDVDGFAVDKWRYRELSLWVKYNSDKRVLRIHLRTPWLDMPSQ